jgi:hypothetical protein
MIFVSAESMMFDGGRFFRIYSGNRHSFAAMCFLKIESKLSAMDFRPSNMGKNMGNNCG